MFDYTQNTGQKNCEDQTLIPHPDGEAWPKCCRDDADGVSCAFIKVQDGGSRLSKAAPTKKVTYGSDGAYRTPSKDPFMCAHRSTDDGYHRVCAGWDACFGNKSRRNA